MGFPFLGTPLSWHETKPYANHVREHGITQFLHTWDRARDRRGDECLWGDEIEYMLIAFDHKTKNAKLSLRQTEILEKLSEVVSQLKDDTPDLIALPHFYSEHGRYMLESTPGFPYSDSIRDLLSVQPNMHYRRQLVKRYLNPDETLLTVTSFPRLGAPGVFTDPYFSPDDAKSSHSLFLPEEVTNPIARYPAATANIRTRRGSKPTINVPIFIDERTPRPFIDPTIPWQRSLYPEDPEAKNGAASTDHIYMDAMCFGMGCCCLQITFQSYSVEEARRMYDALIPVAPIMLALTAASPIWRGYISNVDCRWNVVADSVDDRTEEERGLKPLNENRYIIPKSRCDSVDLYLSTDWDNKPAYNDISVPYHEEVYARLLNHGIDELFSKYMAHIFVRDPIAVFTETIDQDDETSTNHFENIQSTNWQSLRFKPPPPHSSIGWRVEFRTMEVQLTDFENAAFVIFILLLSRAILAFDLNFYIPISKVDENMQRAQRRDAVRTGKFFFRKSVLPPGHASPTISTPSSSGRLRNCLPRVPRSAVLLDTPIEEEYEEMSMEDIFNGKGAFPGLLGLVEAYLGTLEMEPSESLQINKYLDLIRRRANGSLLTTASWMRQFVRSHPSYGFDSVVSQEINYDLMVAVDKIERGILRVPELLPEEYSCS